MATNNAFDPSLQIISRKTILKLIDITHKWCIVLYYFTVLETLFFCSAFLDYARHTGRF